MRAELQDQLYRKYPKFFSQRNQDPTQTLMCWGIECGDGWYSIIEEFCEFLQECGNSWTFCVSPEEDSKERVFEFTQIKEKYGLLCLYYHANNKTMEDMAGIMAIWAEWKSGKVCEECGSPGSLNEGPWYETRCGEHK